MDAWERPPITVNGTIIDDPSDLIIAADPPPDSPKNSSSPDGDRPSAKREDCLVIRPRTGTRTREAPFAEPGFRSTGNPRGALGASRRSTPAVPPLALRSVGRLRAAPVSDNPERRNSAVLRSTLVEAAPLGSGRTASFANGPRLTAVSRAKHPADDQSRDSRNVARDRPGGLVPLSKTRGATQRREPKAGTVGGNPVVQRTTAATTAEAGATQDLSPIDIVPYKRPNYKMMTEKEQSRYRFAFERQFTLLSNLCPKLIKIPDNIQTGDLDAINNLYDESFQLSQEVSPFGKLRMGLVIFFLAVEFIGTKILGLDFTGFTIRQVKKMNIYDPVLMEIGKKYANAVAGDWPPEYKLAFSAFLSAVCFVGASYLSKWVGGGSKDVFLNISDGVVGMVVPGGDAASSEGAGELVPNSGMHNTIGSFVGNLMGMFTGANSGSGSGSSASQPRNTARSGTGKTKARVAIRRNAQNH